MDSVVSFLGEGGDLYHTLVCPSRLSTERGRGQQPLKHRFAALFKYPRNARQLRMGNHAIHIKQRVTVLVVLMSSSLGWKQLSWAFVPTTFRRVLPTIRLFSSSAPATSTQYTIEEEGVDPDVLKKTIRKHCQHLDRFLEAKPVATHTQEAFSALQEALSSRIPAESPIILDSGCGTGKSTEILGKIYPNHTIVGVDRSLVRLTKSGLTKSGLYHREEEEEEPSPLVTREGGNVFLVRAELTDFWRLWLQSSSSSSLQLPEKHFVLYPNPYPKKRRFQNRWYAHPAFPLLLQMQSQELIVRSNWKAYLEDFAAATAAVELSDSPKNNGASNPHGGTAPTITELDSALPAWTNFEQKYFDVGETCYELVLKKQTSTE
eukprot:scaffold8535_cov132-Cylindrotheca_fusiformis.AAC.18